MFVRLACWLVVLVGGSAVCYAGNDSLVQIDRPFKIGQKLRYTGIAEDRTTEHPAADRTGKSRTESVRSISLSADAVVQAVDADGRITKAKYVVTAMDAKIDGKDHALPKKSVVTAELAAGKKTFTLAGGNLTADQESLLDIAIPLASDQDPSFEKIFGTEGKHKAGDSWPLKEDLLAKMLARQGLVAAKGVLAGKVTLTSLDGKFDHHKLGLDCDLKLGQLNHTALPKGSRITSSNGHFTMGCVMENDVSIPPISLNYSYAVFLDYDGAGAKRGKWSCTCGVKRAFQYHPRER